MVRFLYACFLIAGLLTAEAGRAEEVYQLPQAFLAEAFENAPPEKEVFWVTKELRPEVNEIMEHAYPVLRIPYWRKGARTAWILEEIGKVKPITVGVVIDQGKMERLKVLIYRESHGWEVRYPFFTDQFREAQLTDGKRLTQVIDNISGATMSVDALRNVARLALFLDAKVQADADE